MHALSACCRERCWLFWVKEALKLDTSVVMVHGYVLLHVEKVRKRSFFLSEARGSITVVRDEH